VGVVPDFEQAFFGDFFVSLEERVPAQPG